MTLTANDIHYTTDQQRAVVGIQHTFQDGEAWTDLLLRGKPAGAYRGWFAQRLTAEERTPILLTFREETIATGKRFRWDRNAYVAEVWINDVLVDVPEGADLWPGKSAAPQSVLTSQNAYDATSPVDGKNRLLEFIPRDVDLKAGPMRRVSARRTTSSWRFYGACVKNCCSR